MSRPDIEACALWLQRRLGAFVFAVDHPGLPECAGAHRPDQPCNGERGKHPCGKWSRDSTNDPRLILRALARGLRNLGINCERSGLLVVDEDRHGAFAEYAVSIGETIPATFTVTTSKGAHFYFRQAEGEPLGNGRGDLAGRGIDVRGGHRKGGFVVAPGSVHRTGTLYTPVDPAAPVVPVPPWLVVALRSPSMPTRPGHLRPVQAPGSVYGRLRGVVAAVLAAKVGERNNVLYWASCRCRELIEAGRVDEATVIDVLTQAGESIGLGSGEVQATIASGLQGVMA